MKKLTSLLTMLLLAVTSVSLTSCEDEMIADTLEGTWEGNMYISSYYDNRYYDATYSEICFLRDPLSYTTGDGYWVDYYSGAPWDYIANHIRWSVSDGVIRVRFMEENCTVYIYDYYLSGNRFEGELVDGDNRVRFSLRHTSSPNWDDYDYWGYDSWFAKKNPGLSTRSAADTTEVEKPKRVIRTR